MAVCKICGEKYSGNLERCPRCSAPFSPAINKDPFQAPLPKDPYSQFEEDMQTYVDRKKITYICSVCGDVNHIDRRRCSRCGKPRPRTEYIKALKLLKRQKRAKEDVFEDVINNNPEPQAQNEAYSRQEAFQDNTYNQNNQNAYNQNAFDQRERELYERERRLEAEKQQLNQKQRIIYRYEEGPVQNRVITQPFVIVPYVNQNQPLYQYNPEQVYRFQANSFLENQKIQENQQNFFHGARPKPEDLAILRAKKLEEIEQLNQKIEELLESNKKSKRARKKKKRKNIIID